MNSPIKWILGLYCLVTAVVSATYYALAYHSGISDFFWFCNLAFMIAAVGFFWEKNFLLSVVFITAIPTQFFWIVADILHLLGITTMGRLVWLESTTTAGIGLHLNYHFAVLPLTLWGIWKFGYHRRSFWGATVFYFFIMITTYVFTDYRENINCIFFPCDMDYRDPRIYDYGWWRILWRPSYFIFFSGIIHLACLKLFPQRNK